MQEEWVDECLRRNLCQPNDWWIAHTLTSFRNTPDLNYREVGSLVRARIEQYGPKVEAVRSQVHGIGNAQLQAQATRDLDALEYAFTTLNALKEAARNEHLRQLELIQQPQASAPPAAPPMPTRPQEPEPSETEEVGDPKGATDQTEIDATKENSEQAEATAGLVEINSDLLELVEHRESFVVALDRARSMLDEVRDPWAVKHIVDTADKLRAIADLLTLGHDLEMRGKALRFDGFFKAGQLFESPPPGHRANGQIDPLSCFSQTEKKIIRLLRPFEPENYRRLRDQGIKDGTLSENTFKTPAPTKSPKQEDTSGQDPARHLLGYIVDLRQNPSWYETLQIVALAEHPLIYENLAPVVNQFMQAAMDLGTAVQRKMVRLEADKVLADPSK